MVYIQSNKEKTLPHHFDCACALYGAMDSAMDYRLVTFEEVESGKFDSLIRNNLFVGSVEFMREVFKRIGKNDVRLPMNSDRPHEIITLAEAHQRVSNGQKLFIKPVEIKLFTGLVLDGFEYTSLKGLPDDTLVMAYEPFKLKIISEWRLYIHNHQIVDSRNYSGDFRTPVNYGAAITKVNGNKASTQARMNIFPCAYTMDVAILENADNILVEYNDLWAIGNYGMSNDLYLQLLKDRYFEIVK